MPNKTIYVSEDDLPIYQKAQELADGNLSAAISTALKRYVEAESGRREGYEEIVVKVGPGKKGRKQRFTGVLLGEWGRSTSNRVEVFRVYRAYSGKFVVHTTRSAGWTSGDDEKSSKGWRSWVGNWSSEQSWGFSPGESTLRVAETVEELREMLPPELYELVADAAEQPAIEDLDI